MYFFVWYNILIDWLLGLFGAQLLYACSRLVNDNNIITTTSRKSASKYALIIGTVLPVENSGWFDPRTVPWFTLWSEVAMYLNLCFGRHDYFKEDRLKVYLGRSAILLKRLRCFSYIHSSPSSRLRSDIARLQGDLPHAVDIIYCLMSCYDQSTPSSQRFSENIHDTPLLLTLNLPSACLSWAG